MVFLGTTIIIPGNSLQVLVNSYTKNEAIFTKTGIIFASLLAVACLYGALGQADDWTARLITAEWKLMVFKAVSGDYRRKVVRASAGYLSDTCKKNI